jgi:hypothetical protein
MGADDDDGKCAWRLRKANSEDRGGQNALIRGSA